MEMCSVDDSVMKKSICIKHQALTVITNAYFLLYSIALFTYFIDMPAIAADSCENVEYREKLVIDGFGQDIRVLLSDEKTGHDICGKVYAGDHILYIGKYSIFPPDAEVSIESVETAFMDYIAGGSFVLFPVDAIFFNVDDGGKDFLVKPSHVPSNVPPDATWVAGANGEEAYIKILSQDGEYISIDSYTSFRNYNYGMYNDGASFKFHEKYVIVPRKNERVISSDVRSYTGSPIFIMHDGSIIINIFIAGAICSGETSTPIAHEIMKRAKNVVCGRYGGVNAE